MTTDDLPIRNPDKIFDNYALKPRAAQISDHFQTTPARLLVEDSSEYEPRPRIVCPSEIGIKPEGCVNVFS